MTQAQMDARERCKQILSEHFQAWVLGVLTDTEDDKADETEFCYDGGFSNAIGLMRIGERRIYDTRRVPSDEDEKFS